MKIFAASLAALLGSATLVQARPVFIENTSTITSPNPIWTRFGGDVAINGNYALVTAERDDNSDINSPKLRQTAFLYQRSGNRWTLVRQLGEAVINYGVQRNVLSVAMSSTVAVVSTTPLQIYELGPGGWTLTSSDLTLPNGVVDSDDIQIDNGRIINGEYDCGTNAVIIEKGADAVWRRTANLVGARDNCNQFDTSISADVSNSWAVVRQTRWWESGDREAWIYRKQGSLGWLRAGTATIPQDLQAWSLHTHVTISNDNVFVNAGLRNGILRYTNESGQFEIAERIRPVDGSMIGNETSQLENSGNLLLQKTALWDTGSPSAVLNVYQRQDDGNHRHVAALIKRGEPDWPGDRFLNPNNSIAIHGRTVLASSDLANSVLHFELPATIAAPDVRQETFNIGAAPNWSTSPGFRTLRGDRSRVLRQENATVNSRAIFQPVEWTHQAIEVDVDASQFTDEDSSIALITRWQDARNYLELRYGPKRFEIRRVTGGATTIVFQAPVGGGSFIRPGENHRLRLESVGNRHRMQFDGRTYISVLSDGPATGRVGLGTYRASADFDNVLITPSPSMSIYRNDFGTDEAQPWIESGINDWRNEWDETGAQWEQWSTAGEGRLTVGTPTTEQRVETAARLLSSDSLPSTPARWFGVVARYIDEGNHYVLALATTNKLLLLKRVNGTSITLGTFDVPLVTDQIYRIRLDAFGDELRAYLDDRLLFERTDSTHATGSVGMVTNRARAEFSRFAAYQP